MLQCAMMIVKEDGPMGLLKGWTAQYIRLGPQTMVRPSPECSNERHRSNVTGVWQAERFNRFSKVT